MLKKVLLVAFVFALALMAADVTGKYAGEMKQNFGGQERVTKLTFDLKAAGATLTGTVTTEGGQGGPRASEIKEGKVDGNKVSFVTEREGKQGMQKVNFEGTIDGATFKGVQKTDRGGQVRESPFEAKKQ